MTRDGRERGARTLGARALCFSAGRDRRRTMKTIVYNGMLVTMNENLDMYPEG